MFMLSTDFLVWVATLGKVHQLRWPGDAFGPTSHSQSGTLRHFSALPFQRRPDPKQTWEANNAGPTRARRSNRALVWEGGREEKKKRTRTSASRKLWWSRAVCSPDGLCSSEGSCSPVPCLQGSEWLPAFIGFRKEFYVSSQPQNACSLYEGG